MWKRNKLRSLQRYISFPWMFMWLGIHINLIREKQDFKKLKDWCIKRILRIKGFNENKWERTVRMERKSKRMRNFEGENLRAAEKYKKMDEYYSNLRFYFIIN